MKNENLGELSRDLESKQESVANVVNENESQLRELFATLSPYQSGYDAIHEILLALDEWVNSANKFVVAQRKDMERFAEVNS